MRVYYGPHPQLHHHSAAYCCRLRTLFDQSTRNLRYGALCVCPHFVPWNSPSHLERKQTTNSTHTRAVSSGSTVVRSALLCARRCRRRRRRSSRPSITIETLLDYARRLCAADRAVCAYALRSIYSACVRVSAGRVCTCAGSIGERTSMCDYMCGRWTTTLLLSSSLLNHYRQHPPASPPSFNSIINAHSVRRRRRLCGHLGKSSACGNRASPSSPFARLVFLACVYVRVVRVCVFDIVIPMKLQLNTHACEACMGAYINTVRAPQYTRLIIYTHILRNLIYARAANAAQCAVCIGVVIVWIILPLRARLYLYCHTPQLYAENIRMYI